MVLWYWFALVIRAPALGWRMASITHEERAGVHRIRIRTAAYAQSFGELLDHLAEVRELAGVQFDIKSSGHSLHHRDFDRRRRADALAFRDLGGDQDVCAFVESNRLLVRKSDKGSGGIGRP